MGDERPGLNPRRLLRLMGAAVDRCRLDLAGSTVLTEAASGAYVVTPVLAAMAGADVYALAAGNSYATAAEIEGPTRSLARLAGVADRIELVPTKRPEYVAAADIVTNSGQVRPIDAATISRMKPSAVVTLMYESWEYRPADVDLAACRARGIAIAGTNERHRSIDVFSFLGQMAIRQLHDAGIEVRRSRVVVLCDNSFGPFIVGDLGNCGADVATVPALTAAALAPGCDAVLLARQPGDGYAFTAADARLLREAAPDASLVQFWGDADRAALASCGIPVWPPVAPEPGHMGILPSAVGPDPIVRLQAGGLKVGELLARGIGAASPADLEFVQPLSLGAPA